MKNIKLSFCLSLLAIVISGNMFAENTRAINTDSGSLYLLEKANISLRVPQGMIPVLNSTDIMITDSSNNVEINIIKIDDEVNIDKAANQVASILISEIGLSSISFDTAPFHENINDMDTVTVSGFGRIDTSIVYFKIMLIDTGKGFCKAYMLADSEVYEDYLDVADTLFHSIDNIF